MTLTFITITEEIPIYQWQCDILSKHTVTNSAPYQPASSTPRQYPRLTSATLSPRLHACWSGYWESSVSAGWQSRDLCVWRRWSGGRTSSPPPCGRRRTGHSWTGGGVGRVKARPGLGNVIDRIPTELPRIRRVCAHPLPSVCSRWIPLRWQLARCDPSWRGTKVWRGWEREHNLQTHFILAVA